MDTDTLDKLYLEWAQFTKCRTAREIAYETAITDALHHMRDVSRNGPALRVISLLETVLKDPMSLEGRSTLLCFALLLTFRAYGNVDECRIPKSTSDGADKIH